MIARRRSAFVAAAVACLALAGCGTAQTDLTDGTEDLGPAKCPGGLLIGAGSATQRSAVEDVGIAYAARCDQGNAVNYLPGTTREALTSFVDEEADWVGSDAPIPESSLRAARAFCEDGELLSFPLIASPVAIAVNVGGVEELTLPAPVLGRIFSGDITRWDDPAITDANPGQALPDEQINVIARNDGGGPTTALQRYLVDAGGWPSERAVEGWQGVGELGEGTPGVLSLLRGTEHSIGYVEFSSARTNDLTVARLDSGAGPVELTGESAAAGLTGAELTGGEGSLELVVPTAAPEAYPIQTVTYQLVCTTAEKRALLKDYLGFLASDPQQTALGELGYAPLPEPVRGPIRDAIAQIE
ncbi:MAG: substrate-binding domain-containing protein [Propionibacteriaceae bacterium]|nr:substrate-binding domain-containing protein [Propionibacteriaceae bacterium]